jgi:serine/threonine-protein kinase
VIAPNASGRLPAIGEVVAGKYTIAKVIGEGGMGIVYEATHNRLRQRVAIKMLLPSMMGDDVVVSRFDREARAASQLKNPHAARVTDVDATDDGVPYMVMEFLEGHDLETELGRRRRIPCDEAVDFVLQACAAMVEAHALGIVHRDLKPSNLFLATSGDGAIVKVLDFGISKLQIEGDAKLTGAESVMGTAMYMSPEQVRSSMNADARTDIWALGVILYELITGRAPFLGTPTQVAAAIVSEEPADIRSFALVPTELAQIVARVLQKNANDRFQTVRDLVFALAPHATPGSVGRQYAESLLAGTSGSYRGLALAGNVTVRADDLGGATLLNAPAVTDRPARAEGGTAPGWSQHRSGSSRSTTALVWMLVAFFGGTAVLGGGAFAYFRMRARAATQAATAAAAASSEPPLTPAEPAPPPPPASAVPTANAADASAPVAATATPTAARARPTRPATTASAAPPAIAPLVTPPTPPATTPKPPASAPQPGGNPLHL